MEFLGYARKDGSVGTRNHVGVIATVSCACDPASWIASRIPGCKLYNNRLQCSLVDPDKERVFRTLVNLGKNPNLAAVLLVAPDCAAGTDAVKLAEAIAESGKPVEICRLHQPGGVIAAVARGTDTARRMATDASKIKREPAPVSKLRLGIKCGGSTPTSGIVSNAAMGTTLDFVVENGGSGGFSETTEVIGAEQVLAARAVNARVKKEFLKAVSDFEKRLASFPEIDFFGSNPDQHNIASGLSSIEEKSVGAIRKGGTTPLTEVVQYGCPAEGKGMFFVNSPGNDLMAMTALSAAGCTVMTYSTECCAPYGFPFVPVIKLTANKAHFNQFPDLLDYLVDIQKAVTDIRGVGKDLFSRVLEVASGRYTQSELIGYTGTCDIWLTNPAT